MAISGAVEMMRCSNDLFKQRYKYKRVEQEHKKAHPVYSFEYRKGRALKIFPDDYLIINTSLVQGQTLKTCALIYSYDTEFF